MDKNKNEIKNGLEEIKNEIPVQETKDSPVLEEFPAELLEEAPSASSELLELSEEPAAKAPSAADPAPKAPIVKKAAYGAPQPLLEDYVPTDNRKDAAVVKRAEKEAAIAARKKAKTAALIAKAEAQGEARAVAEIKRDTGEDYKMPKAAPAPVAAPQKTKAKPAQKVGPSKQYERFEQKLRKKYKMDKDLLLSSNDVIPGFVIAKGETVIRTYNCLASKKGDGTLSLTSKRLLINAGERSEIGLDRLSGIKYCKYSNCSFLKVLFWLIFFGLGAFMVALPFIYTSVAIPGISDNWQDWFSYLFYACGGVSLLISLPIFISMTRKSFYFNIYAQEDAPFFECKSGYLAKREKKGKVYKYMVANAGKESEKAARELGALIIEAKAGRYDF